MPRMLVSPNADEKVIIGPTVVDTAGDKLTSIPVDLTFDAKSGKYKGVSGSALMLRDDAVTFFLPMLDENAVIQNVAFNVSIKITRGAVTEAEARIVDKAQGIQKDAKNAKTAQADAERKAAVAAALESGRMEGQLKARAEADPLPNLDKLGAIIGLVTQLQQAAAPKANGAAS